MTSELIHDIGQLVICLAVLAIGAYIQITQGQLPPPWDTLLLGILGVLGLGDGVRLLVKRRNSRQIDLYDTKEN